MNRASRDEGVRAPDDRRGRGPDAERHEPEEQQPAAAVAVGQGASDEQQAREGEDVRVHHPLELAGGRVEVLGERRQRDVEDRVVEADREQRLRTRTPRIHQRRAWIWAWNIGPALLGFSDCGTVVHASYTVRVQPSTKYSHSVRVSSTLCETSDPIGGWTNDGAAMTGARNDARPAGWRRSSRPPPEDAARP